MPVDIKTLGHAVKQVQYRHHRAMDIRLAEVGTTLVQWDALRAIARSPGASGRELAGETFQGEQSFGTLATRLETRKLIQRRPGKGRRVEHFITEAGEQVLAAGHPIAEEVLGESFAPLDESERATLLALLQRVAGGGA
ncbi:MarR family winged helix-turn-helix transcriptional regulator [Catenulispora pinisilvae]|uniref:MarR family winged helix-turn-helix transcriptional regulator n=1 Tax=Catenulispora pinisilvae TaxID=2705253 RepID=UPI001891D2F3|nr:MarR family winged helix-turn-helix transcriptional regulator [Catenulispora pinisilvae]